MKKSNISKLINISSYVLCGFKYICNIQKILYLITFHNSIYIPKSVCGYIQINSHFKKIHIQKKKDF